MVVGRPTTFCLGPVDPEAITKALSDIRINHEPLEIAMTRVTTWHGVGHRPYDELTLSEKVSAVAVAFGPNRVGPLGEVCRVFEQMCRAG